MKVIFQYYFCNGWYRPDVRHTNFVLLLECVLRSNVTETRNVIPSLEFKTCMTIKS